MRRKFLLEQQSSYPENNVNRFARFSTISKN